MTGEKRRARPVWVLVASLGTWLSALVIAGVGVASIVIGGGLFAAGVGAMLLIYAVLLGLVGWAAHHGTSWADGLLVASSLLHLIVVISLLSSGSPPWFLIFALRAAVVLVAAFMPATRRWTAD